MNLWACLEEDFSKVLAEEREPTLHVGEAIPWAGVSDRMKSNKRASESTLSRKHLKVKQSQSVLERTILLEHLSGEQRKGRGSHAI